MPLQMFVYKLSNESLKGPGKGLKHVYNILNGYWIIYQEHIQMIRKANKWL